MNRQKKGKYNLSHAVTCRLLAIYLSGTPQEWHKFLTLKMQLPYKGMPEFDFTPRKKKGGYYYSSIHLQEYIRMHESMYGKNAGSPLRNLVPKF